MACSHTGRKLCFANPVVIDLDLQAAEGATELQNSSLSAEQGLARASSADIQNRLNQPATIQLESS